MFRLGHLGHFTAEQRNGLEYMSEKIAQLDQGELLICNLGFLQELIVCEDIIDLLWQYNSDFHGFYIAKHPVFYLRYMLGREILELYGRSLSYQIVGERTIGEVVNFVKEKLPEPICMAEFTGRFAIDNFLYRKRWGLRNLQGTVAHRVTNVTLPALMESMKKKLSDYHELFAKNPYPFRN